MADVLKFPVQNKAGLPSLDSVHEHMAQFSQGRAKVGISEIVNEVYKYIAAQNQPTEQASVADLRATDHSLDDFPGLCSSCLLKWNPCMRPGVVSCPDVIKGKFVYISAPQPIGCFKHEEGVSCSRDFGPKFRCGKIPCEFIFHRAPI